MRELYPHVPIDGKYGVLSKYRPYFEHLNIDCSGKAILNIRADLWLPADVPVVGTILYYLKDELLPVDVGRTIPGRPYPNQKIVSISKRFGKRKAKKYIPLIFDSLDELRKIDRIEIIWEIFDETVIADYSVSFEDPQQDCIYSLWTYDKRISNNKENGDLTIRHTDGKLENAHTQSIYDDFYFLTLCNEELSIVEELHRPDSQFRIDFDNLEKQHMSIINASLRNIAKNMHSTVNHTESIYFYHTAVLLNDYTA